MLRAGSREKLEGGQVKGLFEDAMRRQAGTDFAFYPLESVAGRLRAGVIRTGDIYTLESWQDDVTVVEIQGSRIGGALLAQLHAGGVDPVAGRVYTVATTGYAAREITSEALGTISSLRRGARLRDATIDYLLRRPTASPT